MNRRSFLKLGAAALAGSAVAKVVPVVEVAEVAIAENAGVGPLPVILGEAVESAGLVTSVGLNFYDLRGPVELLYPVYSPLRRNGRIHGRG